MLKFKYCFAGITNVEGINLYYYVIALLVFSLDQWTKKLIVQHMQIGESIPLIQGVFQLTSHRNRGAAFGILQNQRWLFILITLAVAFGIIYYLRKVGKNRPMISYSLALILGGAAGNFLDRLFHGEVVDFLDFTLIHYPIFNVADSAIVIGVCLFILDTLREMKAEKRG
jgi:signal peptidase II